MEGTTGGDGQDPQVHESGTVTLQWQQVMRLVEVAAAGREDIGSLKARMLSNEGDITAVSTDHEKLCVLVMGERGDNGMRAELTELQRNVRLLTRALVAVSTVAIGVAVALTIEILKRGLPT